MLALRGNHIPPLLAADDCVPRIDCVEHDRPSQLLETLVLLIILLQVKSGNCLGIICKKEIWLLPVG